MYSYDTRVGYSFCGPDGSASIPAVINLMQDCSTFQSEELGIGLKELMEAGRAWLLSSWQVVFDRMPVENEKIKVSTYAYRFKGFYGYRNFTITDSNENVCAYANSIWFYFDINAGKPVKAEPLNGKTYPVDDPFPMETAPRKIVFPGDFNEIAMCAESFKVNYSALDTNGHVNNCEYIRYAIDSLPSDLLKNFNIKQLRVDYKNAAHLGDVITPRVAYKEDSKKIFIKLSDPEGLELAGAELSEAPYTEEKG